MPHRRNIERPRNKNKQPRKKSGEIMRSELSKEKYEEILRDLISNCGVDNEKRVVFLKGVLLGMRED